MANLTIAIDDDVLRQARIRALELDTSVNSLLRDYLEAFAGAGRMAARERVVSGAAELSQPRNLGSRDWTRDELHER